MMIFPMPSRRVAPLTLALLLSLAGSSAASAQGAPSTPPPRLPSASPPPPAPVPPAAQAAASAAEIKAMLPPQPAPPSAPLSRTATPDASVLVAEPAAPPAGATMRCKDGTYLSGAPSADRCTDRGGLGVILPAPLPLPPAARPATARTPMTR